MDLPSVSFTRSGFGQALAEDCDRDYWLDAEDAVAYGICESC